MRHNRELVDWYLANQRVAQGFIPGLPKPKGSKSAVLRNGKVTMFETSKGLPEWEKAVQLHLRDSILSHAVRERNRPVFVQLVFVMPRTKTVTRPEHTLPPDLDKLVRAVCDCLVREQVMVDDGQITDLHASKRYAEEGEDTGVWITVAQGAYSDLDGVTTVVWDD